MSWVKNLFGFFQRTRIHEVCLKDEISEQFSCDKRWTLILSIEVSISCCHLCPFLFERRLSLLLGEYLLLSLSLLSLVKLNPSLFKQLFLLSLLLLFSQTVCISGIFRNLTPSTLFPSQISFILNA